MNTTGYPPGGGAVEGLTIMHSLKKPSNKNFTSNRCWAKIDSSVNAYKIKVVKILVTIMNLFDYNAKLDLIANTNVTP